MPEGFDFVAQVTTAASADDWVERCRRAERLGYSGISISDHLSGQLAPLVALAAAAQVTERVTLGMNVLANDFRHPAMLAKELATLDLLSGGRVVAGIGAGWMTTDYTESGIPLDRPGIRIDRLLESVAILRGLWADGPFTFAGTHYRITGLEGRPKPVQRPGPPVLIGGGARRILTEAGRHADIVGIALDNRSGVMGERSGRSATAAAMREKLGWIRDGASGRATPPVCSVRVLLVAVVEDAWRAASDLGRPLGLDAAEVLESPHALIGEPQQIADVLARRRDEFGITNYVVSQDAIEALAAVLAVL